MSLLIKVPTRSGMTSEKILAFARMTRKENGDGKAGMT
jgi:hypothetical protein